MFLYIHYISYLFFNFSKSIESAEDDVVESSEPTPQQDLITEGTSADIGTVRDSSRVVTKPSETDIISSLTLYGIRFHGKIRRRKINNDNKNEHNN